MNTNRLNRTSRFFLLGAPVLLLLLSLGLPHFYGNDEAAEEQKEFNPFLRRLPTEYERLIGKNKTNDSTFFCVLRNDGAVRELLVFKDLSNFSKQQDAILRTKFRITLSPQLGNSELARQPITLNLSNEGVLFNQNNRTYGVFRKPLPFINIKKLEIGVKSSKKDPKLWKSNILNPFKEITMRDVAQRTLDTDFLIESPNPYSAVFKSALTSNNISFLPHTYFRINDTLVQVSPNVKEYQLKRQLTMAPIAGNEAMDLWELLENKIDHVVFDGPKKDVANTLIKQYKLGEKRLTSLIDIEKFATFIALKNIFSSGCTGKISFIFNSETNLIEPFFEQSSCLGKMSKSLKKPTLRGTDHLELYTKKLNELAQQALFDELIVGNDSIVQELALINSYHPRKIFDHDLLKVNQRVIQKSLNPETLIISELISIDNTKLIVRVNNTSDYPVDILGLNFKSKKRVLDLNPSKTIRSGSTDTITMGLPRSFENLFVNKKKKVTGFELARHIYDVKIPYTVSGLDKTYLSNIAPYPENEIIGEDLFRSESAINNHEDIVVDDQKRTIGFSKDSVVISSALIIPKGYAFTLGPGTVLNLVNNAKVISYAPLSFKGTYKNPIKIYSSDKTGQGFLILSDGERSYLDFVDFQGLKNPNHGNWNVTGAITFYESPVNLENVSISENRCEDALNIVRTKFVMKNCNISKTQSDAFDGDFVQGAILNCRFNELGNDAIDVSGSKLTLNDVEVYNAGDKGLSAGEDSMMIVENVKIFDSEIAVAGKDLSVIEARNLTITNTKLAITAFKKKPEFGPSNVTVSGLLMKNVETNYLIENSSSLTVDGEKIKTSDDVKGRMYGVEFGVSSDETRNSNN